MLCNFLVQTLRYLGKKIAHETLKIALKSSIVYSPFRNFQYCHHAQNQPKSHTMFYKNSSPWDLYIMSVCKMFLMFGRMFIAKQLMVLIVESSVLSAPF